MLTSREFINDCITELDNDTECVLSELYDRKDLFKLVTCSPPYSKVDNRVAVYQVLSKICTFLKKKIDAHRLPKDWLKKAKMITERRVSELEATLRPLTEWNDKGKLEFTNVRVEHNFC